MLNELAKLINENAKEKGWWDEERTFAEIISLCHSELSEALEEYRKWTWTKRYILQWTKTRRNWSRTCRLYHKNT